MNARRSARKIRKQLMRMIRYLFGVKTFQEAWNLMRDCQKSIETKLGKKIEDVGTYDDMKICGELICLYKTLKRVLDIYNETQVFEFNMKELEERYGY